MKQQLIAKMEETLFNLHPEVKTYYNVIKVINELPSGNSIPINAPKVESADHVQAVPQQIIIQPGVKETEGYDTNHNLQTRVINIIKELGTFVRVSDIISKIKEYEPDFSATISAALTQLRLTGQLRNYKPTNNNKLTYWGLTEWQSEGFDNPNA